MVLEQKDDGRSLHPRPALPPPSPAPSSSDDAPHISLTPAAASLVSSSPASSSSSRCKSSSASSSVACLFHEPTSSTTNSNPPAVGVTTGACSSCEVTSGAASLEDMVSSRHRVESLIMLDPPSSSLHFSPEVSSSNLGLDETCLGDAPHSFTSGASGSTSPRAPDSSEAATGSHFRSTWQPRSSCPNLAVASSTGWPQECLRPTSESLVSRSTWLASSSAAAGTPSSWHSEAYWGTLDASDVSSTGPPDSTKSSMGACQAGWQRDYPGAMSHELTSSTTLSRETVNSTVEVGAASSSWCQETEGATAAAATWECDSLSCEVGATSSLNPWPSSSTSQSTVSFPSSNIPPSNSPVNSTSQCPAESSLQLPTWRCRASSAPLSLTRVVPTAPPPRPPTPPRQQTPPASRHRAHIQPPTSVRRSVSPPARSHGRIQSPSANRRSLSPPQLHQSQHALPVRRSASPPHRHHAHAAQPPRCSVSPVSFQGTLGQPLSPTVRRRPRHRSARTPSPRPPRPPNSTPEPAPPPSQQQSPRPHYTKMRGR